MRTLQTQMRLRRLVRAHSEFSARLAAAPPSRQLAGAARDRLLKLTADLRETWAREAVLPLPAAAAAELPARPLQRHVSRAIAAIEVAIVAMDRPGVDLNGLDAEFQEAALPLMLCLQGLEHLPQDQLAGLLRPELARSA
ncbi:MAG: hypothetical protein ACREPA_08200 [Candidatus Dormibacteraceae bacterium]